MRILSEGLINTARVGELSFSFHLLLNKLLYFQTLQRLCVALLIFALKAAFFSSASFHPFFPFVLICGGKST